MGFNKNTDTWIEEYRDNYWINVENARVANSISRSDMSRLVNKPVAFYSTSILKKTAMKLSSAMSFCSSTGLSIDEALSTEIKDYYKDTVVGRFFNENVTKYKLFSRTTSDTILFDYIGPKALVPAFVNIEKFQRFRDILIYCLLMPGSLFRKLYSYLLITEPSIKSDYYPSSDYDGEREPKLEVDRTETNGEVDISDLGEESYYFSVPDVSEYVAPELGTEDHIYRIHNGAFFSLDSKFGTYDVDELINLQFCVNYQRIFWDAIRARFEDSKYNMEKLAAKLGLEKNQLYRYTNSAYQGDMVVNKAELRIDTAIRICESIGVSIGTVFGKLYGTDKSFLNKETEMMGLFWDDCAEAYSCFPILVFLANLLDERTDSDLEVIRKEFCPGI